MWRNTMYDRVTEKDRKYCMNKIKETMVLQCKLRKYLILCEHIYLIRKKTQASTL